MIFIKIKIVSCFKVFVLKYGFRGMRMHPAGIRLFLNLRCFSLGQKVQGRIAAVDSQNSTHFCIGEPTNDH